MVTMAAPFRTFLVGTDNMLWDGLRANIQRMPEVRIVGETSDPRGAADCVRRLAPDLILLCSPVQGRPAAGLALDMRAHCAASKIIVIAEEIEAPELPTYVAAEVAAHLLWKNVTNATLQRVLSAVAGGLVVTDPAIVNALVQTNSPESPTATPLRLNDRQRAVLHGLSAGRSHEEIAVVEQLSVRTVERIITGLQLRLEAHSSFALGLKAARLQLIS